MFGLFNKSSKITAKTVNQFLGIFIYTFNS